MTAQVLLTLSRLRTSAVLRWSVSGALLVAIWLLVDPSALMQQLGNVRWAIAAPALAGLIASHLLACAGWRGLAQRIAGLRLGWSAAAPIYYGSLAAGAVTPANVGGDAYRAFGVRARGAEWSDTVTLTLTQRAASYLAASVLGVGGLLALPGSARAGVIGLVLIVLMATVVALATSRGGPVARLLLRPVRFVQRRWPIAVGRVGSGTFAYGVGWALCFHMTGVVMSYLLLLAVHPGAPALALAALAAARVAALLPVSVSGIGVQEGGVALLLPVVGVPAQAAVAASLLSRLALVVVVAIGAVIVASRRSSPAASSEHTRPLDATPPGGRSADSPAEHALGAAAGGRAD